MQQALHIFLKDSRQFRYPIVLLLVWTAVFAAAGPAPWEDDGPARTAVNLFDLAMTALSRYVFPIAWCYLIAQVIHADALADPRQFWLTRPYHRASLAAAKAMFVLAYLMVPLMLAQAAIVVYSGLPLSPYIAGLIWNQILLTIVLVLPAAAVAAMTSTLGQFLVAALLVPAVLLLSGARWLRSWGGFEWTRLTVVASIIVVVVLAILIVQFAQRRTSAARRIAVFGALGAVMAGILFPWQAAFAVQTRVTGEWEGTLRADLAPPKPPPVGVPSRPRDQLQLHFQLSGLPAAMRSVCEAREITIEVPNGPTWETGPITRASLLTPEGECAFGLPVPVWLLPAAGDGTVTLRAVLYNTLFGEERVMNVPVGPMTPTRTEAGFCVATSRDRWAHLRCRTAFRGPRSPQWSAHNRSGYSPFPSVLLLQPVNEVGHAAPGTVDAVPVITRDPVGHVRMVVTAEHVRLRDYQVGR